MKRHARAFALSLWLGLISSVLVVSPEARAHGGIPRAFEILVEPGNPNDVILRSDLWGFFRTRDGGKSWEWTCAEAYESDSLVVSHQDLALAPGGRLYVANSFRGLFYTDDGCNYTEVPELGGDKLVVDVRVHDRSVYALTSTNTNSDAGISGLLFQSTDGGAHFPTIGAPLPPDFAASALGIAPSDEKRLYVVGRILQAVPGSVIHSEDGGTTWARSEVPTADAPLVTLRVAAIHPTRPDVVFLWWDLPEEKGQDSPDEIWGSGDGGKTWKKIYTGGGDLPGFAFSPDGTQILIGGPVEGLMIATITDAFASGQSAFTQYFTSSARSAPGDRRVWGIHWDEAGLMCGLDEFGGTGPFMYGAFDDASQDFTRLMSVCDTQFGSCGAGTTVATKCTRMFTGTQSFEGDYLKIEHCTGKVDAGPGDAGSVRGGGGAGNAPKDDSGCAYAGRSAGADVTALSAVGGTFLLGLGFRRSRGRRRQGWRA